jgi:hypothetical protein
MREITSEPDLQAALAARQGYLANQETAGTFKVHDLHHLGNSCV